jgi:hypothetical protein
MTRSRSALSRDDFCTQALGERFAGNGRTGRDTTLTLFND